MFDRLRDSLHIAAWVALTALASPSAVAQCGLGGDCGSVGSAGGCADTECCEAVCAIDPFCCSTAWDGLCVQAAQNGCDSAGGTPLIVAAFGGSVTLPGGVAITATDLAAFDPTTGAWSLYFKGSNVGLSKTISAATQLPDGDLLISTTSNGSISGMSGGSSFTRNDLLRFTPTALGSDTAGSWAFFFDGSDVGLTTSGLSINAASMLPDGSIVMGTANGGDVPGLGAVTPHDLIRFTPTSLGSSTAGSWSLYMDGSDLGLGANGNKLDSASVRHDGSILLSTNSTSSFQGFKAQSDLVLFEPTSLGDSTAGTLSYFIRAYEMGLDSSPNIRGSFLADISRASGDARNGGGDGGGGPPPAGCGAGGDCCAESDGPGCADVSCCQMICDLDPYCCEVRWDQYCVMAATFYCEPCMPGPQVVVTFGSATELPGGITVAPCDLAQYDLETGEWSVYFRGANVGIGGRAIGGTTVMPDGDLLINLTSSGSLEGLTGAPSGTSFTRNDILRFTPTLLGEETAGSWTFFFDGSDVGLSSSYTAIRALALLDDGGLVIGCNTGGSLPGVGQFTGHDLVVFDATSLGASTAGTFAPYFRGGDVGLSTNGERLDFAFVNADGMLLLSTRSSFSATGNVTGLKSDLVAFFPDSLGDNTAGDFAMFMTGIEAGLSTSADVRGGFVLYPVVPLMPRPDPGDGGDGGGGGGDGSGGDGNGGDGGGGDGSGGDGGNTDETGWTELVPSFDSRLIYVSTSGDDAAAALAKGRGYYLPGDPEIGADPTNPVGPIVAYGSVVEASKRFRGRNWNGTDSAGGIPNYGSQLPDNSNGYPDWILFRRGESYSMPVVPTAWGDQVRGVSGLIGNWVQGQGQFSYQGGGAHGRSESEPAVITAWGLPSEPRPSFDLVAVSGSSRNMAMVSIETPNNLFVDYTRDGNSADNLLMEDVKARSFGAWNTTSMKNARFRRCVVSGNFSGSGHNQGLFLGGTDTVTIEECVFDRNGYKENPDDATTWTAGVVSGPSAGALPPGTGVQPTRTYFDRNLYLSSYDSMTLRGNIISRNGGGSSVQMREGGLAERNLFIWNESALGMTHPESDPARHKGSLAKDNVVLHDDCFLPPGGWGQGIGAGGADDDLAVVDGNIVAHFHRGNNGGQSLGVSGKSYNSATRPASQLMRGIIKDNAIYREFGGVGIMVMDTVHANGALDADVTGNAVSTSSQLSMQGSSSKPATFTYSGNRFHSTTTNGLFRWGWESNSNGDYRFAPFTDGTFSQWQAAGFDTDGSFTADFAAFKSAAGWTAPERDIVSYMQSADPTYVVNEDVYVDEESTVTQDVRQKVWEVLMNNTAWPGAMTEAQAKLTARRYHAFITFIQRAKANRKGVWDTRWTAEAVSNHIRAGFGKAPVTGPYQTTLSDLANYTPITP